jgi:methionyl-tRNA formyltransferase
MKILVVTSEVTFVPENYNLFLEGLFKELANEVDISMNLVILKNNSPALIAKGLALILMGARHIGYHLMKNSIKAAFKDRKNLTETFKINTHYFLNPNTPEFREFVKNFETDLLINARTRFIYKNKILKIPKIAAINIHHGLLPDYRGTMCDLWALKEDRPTGFTIHVMDKKIDNGVIIKTIETSVLGNPLRSNFSTLIKESSRIEGIEMAKTILTIKKNYILPIQADNISLNPIYTKNPNFLDIRKLLQKGIEL